MTEGVLKKIWNTISEHWGLKLVSLFLAIGFWFYAGGKEGVEVTRSVPLRIETESNQFSVAARSVNTIYVRLQATRGLLSVLSSGEMSAFHKITGISQAGEYSFRISANDIQLPSDEIRVTGIFPETITVTIDETITKKLSVIPNLVGEPAFGYKILTEKIEIDPNAILVEGPKAKLDALESVSTEPIELVGRIHSFRRLVRVILDPDLRATADSIIDVFIPIREEHGERNFSNILVKPLGLPNEGSYVNLETPKISFDLKGPKEELASLANNGVFAYVDVTGLPNGTHQVSTKFILPETVSLKGASPLVKLRIDRVK